MSGQKAWRHPEQRHGRAGLRQFLVCFSALYVFESGTACCPLEKSLAVTSNSQGFAAGREKAWTALLMSMPIVGWGRAAARGVRYQGFVHFMQLLNENDGFNKQAEMLGSPRTAPTERAQHTGNDNVINRGIGV